MKGTRVTKPWRGRQFFGGYSAEYLPHQQRTWRIIKRGGRPVIFATEKQARDAAENAFLASIDGKVRATLPVDPERIAAKLEDEAERWLRSRREDIKAQEVQRRPGRRPLLVLNGRAG